MIITAPEDILPFRGPSIFLAGGITGCPNWQATAEKYLNVDGYRLFNPRRADYAIYDKSNLAATNLLASQQIVWEWDAIDKSSFMFFWFPKETLCPIALFELGKALGRDEQSIVVGTDPEYSRRLDVIMQVAMERADIIVKDSLEATIFSMIQLLDADA